MNILVVAGDCLSVNSSANLCHLAYIKGLVGMGFHVELLCAKDDGAALDNSLKIPDEVTCHYYGVSLYEKLSHVKKHMHHDSARADDNSGDKMPEKDASENSNSHGGGLKAKVRGLYGVYGPSKAWNHRAKHFSSDVFFDYIISLSCPFISHLTAYDIIKSGKVKYGKWIQVWEDPWFSDVAYASDTEECKKEEEFLCSVAEDIVYVSPVTLSYQKKLFPAYAEKMRFVPVPSYYSTDKADSGKGYIYGYFGDFVPEVRNLEPFYSAAVNGGKKAYICGNPVGLFASDGDVSVFPRMPLDELKKFEQSANVLVFLCNLHGGQIPGKIYQYSASNKTVLFILDGTEEEIAAIRDYFSRFDRYVFCKNNTADILRAMEDIESGKYKTMAKSLNCFRPEKIISQILG